MKTPTNLVHKVIIKLVKASFKGKLIMFMLNKQVDDTQLTINNFFLNVLTRTQNIYLNGIYVDIAKYK